MFSSSYHTLEYPAPCSEFLPADRDPAETEDLDAESVRQATVAGPRSWTPRRVCATTLFVAIAVAAGRDIFMADGQRGDSADIGAKQQLHLVAPGGCLCLFDVDRTLTAKQLPSQGSAAKGSPQARCQNAASQGAVEDPAFQGGLLRLSELGQNPFGTACAPCRKGVISAGEVGSAEEKSIVATKLGTHEPWSPASNVFSPLVHGCGDGAKHVCAKGILEWYRRAHHVDIKPGDVYFFDDHAANINCFADTGMNAHQVSCYSRDGAWGLCGGQMQEIRLQKGLSLCGG